MRKPTPTLPGVTRRQVLTWSTGAIAATATGVAKAVTLTGAPGWTPFSDNPPETFEGQGLLFFTGEEAATIDAIVDRLIPADELSMGGKDAGCTVFIDRQLHGFYGTYERLYMEGPFDKGSPEQGDQSPLVPRERYRTGIAALNKYTQSAHQKAFKDLKADQQDEILHGLEQGKIAFEGYDSAAFFAQVLINAMEGFFADPVYGGNKGMVSWKMLGFPGARYDYRDEILLHNQDLKLQPVSIADLSPQKKGS